MYLLLCTATQQYVYHALNKSVCWLLIFYYFQLSVYFQVFTFIRFILDTGHHILNRMHYTWQGTDDKFIWSLFTNKSSTWRISGLNFIGAEKKEAFRPKYWPNRFYNISCDTIYQFNVNIIYYFLANKLVIRRKERK